MSVHKQSKATNKKEGNWVWCLHCERAYIEGEFKKSKNSLELCPYPDCNGDTVMDSWSWSRVRKNHPDYPKVPEKGKVYPLY